jgi:hypothetical protein
LVWPSHSWECWNDGRSQTPSCHLKKVDAFDNAIWLKKIAGAVVEPLACRFEWQNKKWIGTYLNMYCTFMSE